LTKLGGEEPVRAVVARSARRLPGQIDLRAAAAPWILAGQKRRLSGVRRLAGFRTTSDELETLRDLQVPIR
jgi:hypothetical protein